MADHEERKKPGKRRRRIAGDEEEKRQAAKARYDEAREQLVTAFLRDVVQEKFRQTDLLEQRKRPARNLCDHGIPQGDEKNRRSPSGHAEQADGCRPCGVLKKQPMESS
jgi:hypothetical protein